MIRTQFPLKLGINPILIMKLKFYLILLYIAYAFTVHKVQGQTIQRLIFDVREQVFSHGALYVGLSRVRKFSNIAFVVNRENVSLDESYICLKNIVYKEVLF